MKERSEGDLSAERVTFALVGRRVSVGVSGANAPRKDASCSPPSSCPPSSLLFLLLLHPGRGEGVLAGEGGAAQLGLLPLIQS